ncbi:MAG: hypothetical protein K9H64_11560 [Bacteroidales bacterium]|nr:hypothetical protein [Bacteroidales bacterium]MCF8456628.1 hypothetical protein [Bacteroidales bacterium]
MKTLTNYSTDSNNILSIAELLMIKGGTSDEDPNKTDQKPAEKKDEVVYPTIDGDFDYWPEPEV